jgi:hypothetical protein
MKKCRKGVDPVLEGHSKFIAIDEEANHEIMHRYRFFNWLQASQRSVIADTGQ